MNDALSLNACNHFCLNLSQEKLITSYIDLIYSEIIIYLSEIYKMAQHVTKEYKIYI